MATVVKMDNYAILIYKHIQKSQLLNETLILFKGKSKSKQK